MLTVAQAKSFSDDWLPAWTGNQPDRLMSFYSDDAFYLDPGVPQGLKGRENILPYFKKLLNKYPDWIWTQIEAIPMEGGFLNKWLAKIPHNDKVIECVGVCFVIFDENQKIKRNEVYFDMSKLRS